MASDEFTPKRPTGPAALAEAQETELREKDAEPPVVARLVVEIRSDGSRTIARGAVEDALAGQRVAIHAEGTSPMELAFALAKSMFRLPQLAQGAARALLRPRRRPRDPRE